MKSLKGTQIEKLLLASFAGDDAQSYRVFETELTMGKADYTKGELILKQLHRHRGTAGDRYLRALTDPAMLRVLEEDFRRLPELLGRQQAPVTSVEAAPELAHSEQLDAQEAESQLGLF